MGMQKFRAPALPLAPVEYEQPQFSQLLRVLALYFNQLDSTTPLQIDGLRLLNLATSGYNLPTGTVFEDNSFLKIVRLNDAYTEGLAATTALGTVDVVTSFDISPTARAVVLAGIVPTVI